MLSYLIFNRYQMATPAHREARGRLVDMDWNTSVQNLLNWADKGAVQLNLVIPALKKVALQDGANVHVNETWLRYQTYNEKRKTYMWCLVNRKALARTSATPGKTATINFYRLDTMRMVDLPGYGYAKVSDSERRRWSELIEGYFDDDRDMRLVLQLWDIRHDPSKDDYQMLEYMVERGIPLLSY